MMLSPPEKPADRRLLLAGLGACALALLLMLFDAGAALAGWLTAFILWSAAPIGSLLLLMMVRLIPGSWREELEQPAWAVSVLMLMVPVAALPILLGASALFPWAGVAREGFQDVYLTRGFFALRTLVFFGALIGLLVLLTTRPSWSTPVASVGLIVLALLDTIFAVDWIMSLEPDFHSSGFGLFVLAIQATVALTILIIMRLDAAGAAVKTGVLAGLLLTDLLFWAYFSFMQYVIIWSGDLPTGVAWYQHRGTGLWSVVEIAIAVLSLAPVSLLLLPVARRSHTWLRALACAVLLGRAFEVAWLVLPDAAILAVALPAALLALAGLSAVSFAILAVGPARLRSGPTRARTT
jgi:hypothetical protein